MELAEYIIFFVLVVSTGAGIPGPGDAAMIAAGTLAGEGRLNIGVVVVTSLSAERRIEFVRVGRHVRISESALADFIQAGRVEPLTAGSVRRSSRGRRNGQGK
jgi:excisionase family DNA binding protein